MRFIDAIEPKTMELRRTLSPFEPGEAVYILATGCDYRDSSGACHWKVICSAVYESSSDVTPRTFNFFSRQHRVSREEAQAIVKGLKFHGWKFHDIAAFSEPASFLKAGGQQVVVKFRLADLVCLDNSAAPVAARPQAALYFRGIALTSVAARPLPPPEPASLGALSVPPVESPVEPAVTPGPEAPADDHKVSHAVCVDAANCLVAADAVCTFVTTAVKS